MALTRLAVVVALVTALGCGSGSADRPTPLRVSAAASLTEAFNRLSAAHPGVRVTFTFDSSTTLAAQIADGAPADVFASADETNMAILSRKSLVAGAPQAFARNRLVIVTRPGNPKAIRSLADLRRAGVVALCGKGVPCGKVAQQALRKAGVTLDEHEVTRGQNAKATLTAVTEGDAAAGIVYVTDAKAAGRAVTAVRIPARQNAVTTYTIAVLKGSAHAAAARTFLAEVEGPAGRAVLERSGFLPPP